MPTTDVTALTPDAPVFDLSAPSRKALPVEISPEASAATAFRAVTAECIAHWRANEALVLEHRRMVNLHQMRVGIRRLRSSFSLFRPLWAQVPGADDAGHELRSLALTFGAARDLDVLITGELADLLTPGQIALLLTSREAAYDAVVDRLHSPQWAAVCDRLDALLSGPLWTTRADPDIRTTAGDALSRRDKRVRKGGARLRSLSDEARHRVRIEAKKLRYGCEFFDTVYAGGLPLVDSFRGPVSTPRAYAAAVEEIQGVLGRLNDHAAATAYLQTVGVSLPDLDVPALLDEADVAFAAYAALPRFWRP